MSIFQPVLSEIVTKASTALGITPVPGQNWFTDVQQLRKSVVEQIKDGRITLPAMLIGIGTGTVDQDFGITNYGTKRYPLEIHYIAQLGATTGNQGAIHDLLVALCLSFDGLSNPTTFQVIEPGEIMTGSDSALNLSLAANSEVQIISGCVRWQPGIQVDITGL